MHPWGRVRVNIVEETQMEKHIQIVFNTKTIKSVRKGVV